MIEEAAPLAPILFAQAGVKMEGKRKHGIDQFGGCLCPAQITGENALPGKHGELSAPGAGQPFSFIGQGAVQPPLNPFLFIPDRAAVPDTSKAGQFRPHAPLSTINEQAHQRRQVQGHRQQARAEDLRPLHRVPGRLENRYARGDARKTSYRAPAPRRPADASEEQIRKKDA